MEELLDDCPNLEEVLEITDGNLNKASHLLDIRLESTNQMIKCLTNNIDNLSEEEFYDRLMNLKTEHGKTLSLCEQLYLLQAHQDCNSENYENDVFEKYAKIKQTDSDGDKFVRISIKNLKDKLIGSDDLFNMQDRPRLSRIDFKRASTTTNVTRSSFINDSEKDFDEGGMNIDEWYKHPIGRTVQTKVKELRQLNTAKEEAEQVQMENTEAIFRRRSFSLTLRHSTKSSQDAVEQSHNSNDDIAAQWRHRITIPQPFSMTLRDELAGGKHKSRSMIQFEKEVAERKRQEEEALRKRFKAKPLPAHVYIPLFDAMMEDQQARRDMVKQHRIEILKANEKPFHFYIREKNKEVAKQDKVLESKHGERVNTVIRAKPIPKSVKEARIEKMMEDELMREIKVKMRAKKLYQEAHAPPGLEKRQKEMEARLKEKMDEVSNSNAAGTQPVKAKKIPNFKKIHQKVSQSSWTTSEPTKPQPFNLSSDRKIRTRPSSAGPTISSRSSIKSMESTHDWNKSIIAANEAPLAPTNRSSNLRESVTREKLSSRERREIEKTEEERNKKRRQDELATSLRMKMSLGDSQNPTEERVKERATQLKKQDAAYKKYLEEMNQNVRNRESLLEQQTILIATHKADRDYHKGLSRHSLDYNELKKESEAPIPNVLVE